MRVRDWSRPARQSPVAMLIGLLKGFREAGPVLILLLAAYLFKDADPEEKTNRSLYTLLGIMMGGVLVSLRKIIAYFFTRFWIEGEVLMITRGLISKKRTEIPIANITGLHRSQQWIHRISNTCRLSVETAGSEKAEWEADAMTLADADALQQYLHTLGKAAPTEEKQVPPQEQVFQYSTGDLLKLALTENHLQSFFIILLFVIARLQDLREYLGFDSVGYVEQQGSILTATVQVIGGSMLAGLLVATLFSGIRIVMKYAHFRLILQGGVHILTRGLIHSVRKAMPIRNVEFITWKSNWLRSRFHVYMLRMHALAESELEEETHMQMPIANDSMLHALLQTYTNKRPALAEDAVCRRVSGAYVYQPVLLYMFPVAAATGSFLGWKYGWIGSAVVIPLAYAWLHRWIWQQRFRLYICENVLEIRKGVWGTEQLLIEIPRIVSVSIRSSPWQRKKGYSNVILHLPGTRWKIPFLQKKEAEELLNYLITGIEIAGITATNRNSK